MTRKLDSLLKRLNKVLGRSDCALRSEHVAGLQAMRWETPRVEQLRLSYKENLFADDVADIQARTLEARVELQRADRERP